MLDLGFLEDVEKILVAHARTAARPRSSARRCRRRSASSPTATSTTRCIVKVESKNLTVDTVEQFRVEVAAKDKAPTLVEVLKAERPTQAIVFARTKIRCDQLYRTLRDKGMNVKALHGDMSQGSARRRDALVQGRPRADPRRDRRRRARPGHLAPSPTSSTSTSRTRPTSTSTASAAPAASGAPAARSRSSSRASSASSRRSSSTSARRSAPGRRARKVAPAKVEERPQAPREAAHQAPRGGAVHDSSSSSVGRDAGIEPADIVHAVTARGGRRRRGREGRQGPRALLAPLGPAVRGRARDRAGQRRAGQRHGPEARAGQGVTVLLCPPPAGMAS